MALHSKVYSRVLGVCKCGVRRKALKRVVSASVRKVKGAMH